MGNSSAKQRQLLAGAGGLLIDVPPFTQSAVVREVLKPDWQWDGRRPVATP